MSLRLRDGVSAGVGHEAGDVMHLETDVVSEAVREEGAADVFLHDSVRVDFADEIESDQDVADLVMCQHVQIRIVHFRLHRGAYLLLHRIHRLNEPGELVVAA